MTVQRWGRLLVIEVSLQLVLRDPLEEPAICPLNPISAEPDSPPEPDSGLRVEGFCFMVYLSGLGVYGSGFGVQGLKFWVSGLTF